MVFLKSVVTSPTIDVGEYTYYDDPDGRDRLRVEGSPLRLRP